MVGSLPHRVHFLTILNTVYNNAFMCAVIKYLAPLESKLQEGKDHRDYFAHHHTSSK